MATPAIDRLVDDRAVSLEGSATVGEAIDAIRTTSNGAETTIYYVYVLDEDDRLEGVVSMRELLNATDDQSLSAVAVDRVVAVRTTDSVVDIATTITRHGYSVLPVVDDAGRFAGVARAEDVIDALDEETSKNVLRSSIRDVEYDPAEEGEYECFECGTVVRGVSPGTCPNCGGDLRNVRTPLE